MASLLHGVCEAFNSPVHQLFQLHKAAEQTTPKPSDLKLQPFYYLSQFGDQKSRQGSAGRFFCPTWQQPGFLRGVKQTAGLAWRSEVASPHVLLPGSSGWKAGLRPVPSLFVVSPTGCSEFLQVAQGATGEPVFPEQEVEAASLLRHSIPSVKAVTEPTQVQGDGTKTLFPDGRNVKEL